MNHQDMPTKTIGLRLLKFKLKKNLINREVKRMILIIFVIETNS